VRALDAGADDYVTKPFAMDELFARLRALARRGSTAESSPEARIGDYVVDLTNQIVRAEAANGNPPETVRLTPTEWKLLEMLVRNPGKLVSQRQLLTRVWGPAYTRESSYLRV
jgi:two-component system KDP operon response regulator KdpE